MRDIKVGDLVRLGAMHSFRHAKTGRRRWIEERTVVVVEDVVYWEGTPGSYYLRTTDGNYVGALFAHEVLEVEDGPLRLLAEQSE